VTKALRHRAACEQFWKHVDDWGNRSLQSDTSDLSRLFFPERYLERNPLLLPESVKRLVRGARRFSNHVRLKRWRAIRSSRRLLAEKGSPNATASPITCSMESLESRVYRGGGFPEALRECLFAETRRTISYIAAVSCLTECSSALNVWIHGRSLCGQRIPGSARHFVNAPDGNVVRSGPGARSIGAVHIPMDVVSHLDLTSWPGIAGGSITSSE